MILSATTVLLAIIATVTIYALQEQKNNALNQRSNIILKCRETSTHPVTVSSRGGVVNDLFSVPKATTEINQTEYEACLDATGKR